MISPLLDHAHVPRVSLEQDDGSQDTEVAAVVVDDIQESVECEPGDEQMV